MQATLSAKHICKDTDDDQVVCISGGIHSTCGDKVCSGACGLDNCAGPVIQYYTCYCPCHPKKD